MTEPNATVDEAESEVPDGAECAEHPGDAAEFLCRRCGTFGCAACRFAEVDGASTCVRCADKGLGKPIPWERRAELGNHRAFWDTVRLASRSPTRFFRTPKTTESVLGPLAHAALTSTIGVALAYAVAGVLVLIGGGATKALAPPELGDALGAALGVYGCTLLGFSPLAILFTPANAVFSVVYSALMAHGILALKKKTRGTMVDTIRAVSYANAPYVWQWVPVVGLATYPWMIAAETIAIRETHECGTDWAAAAVIGHRVVALVLFLCAYAALGGAMFVLLQERV